MNVEEESRPLRGGTFTLPVSSRAPIRFLFPGSNTRLKFK